MFTDNEKFESTCPKTDYCRSFAIRQAMDGVTISTDCLFKMQSVLNEVCDFCRKNNAR